MNNVYFCSFASTDIKPALKRIVRQAKEFRIFKKCFAYTEKNLPEYAKKRVDQIIEKTGKRRGFGYWSWKPACILDAMSKIPDGSILFYSDAGSHLNVKGKDKFLELIDSMKRYDVWAIKLQDELPDLQWAKMDSVMLLGNAENPLLKSGQIEGGTFLLKKNSSTLKFLSKWNSMMAVENLHYFDDSPSVSPNAPDFKENRHDQTVVSLLLKNSNEDELLWYTSDIYNFYPKDDKSWSALENTSPILRKRDKPKQRGILKKIKRFITERIRP